jgi:hypothetical protein
VVTADADCGQSIAPRPGEAIEIEFGKVAPCASRRRRHPSWRHRRGLVAPRDNLVAYRCGLSECTLGEKCHAGAGASPQKITTCIGFLPWTENNCSMHHG